VGAVEEMPPDDGIALERRRTRAAGTAVSLLASAAVSRASSEDLGAAEDALHPRRPPSGCAASSEELQSVDLLSAEEDGYGHGTGLRHGYGSVCGDDYKDASVEDEGTYDDDGGEGYAVPNRSTETSVSLSKRDEEQENKVRNGILSVPLLDILDICEGLNQSVTRRNLEARLFN
jgi:hypothetical protein